MSTLYAVVVTRPNGNVDVLDCLYGSFDRAEEARKQFQCDRIVEVVLQELTQQPK
jgi:hypothetical protein